MSERGRGSGAAARRAVGSWLGSRLGPWLGSRGARRVGAAALAVAAVVLVALVPLSATPYTNLQLSLVATYAVAILGLNLLTGYAGQISLGQSAFFGIGGYAAAIATVRGGWPLPASFVLACALPAAVGVLVAIPAVRLRGHALAILTLSLPLIAVPLAKRYAGLTGGSEGLTAPMGQAPAWSGLDNDQWTFYVVALLAAALFLLARNAVTGRLGRALSVIRQNEVVAVSMGVSPRRYKALAFAMAAALGGAAGWLYVYTIDFISPVELDLILSVNLLSVMIAGGMGSVLGSLLGGVLYVYIPTVAGTVSPARSSLLYGAILLLVIFLAPGGLARAIRRAGDWLGRALSRRGPGSPGASAAATESEGNVPAMR
jgi:branched-chain amino acid transport system permease protein